LYEKWEADGGEGWMAEAETSDISMSNVFFE